MKKNRQVSLIFIGIFSLTCACNLMGQNSTGWRGNNGNGTVSEFNVPEKWPAELKKEWQIKVGEGDASTILMNNRLYAFVKADNAETLICIDATNGTEIWRTAINPSPEITGPAAGHPGPRSTPFLSNEKIFSLGAGGVLSCLNAKTGKLLWKNDSYKEVPQFYTGSSPLIFDGNCVVQLGGRDNGIVVAFDANSGKEIWKTDAVPCTYSSPAIMKTFDNLLLVQSENELLGISNKGELLWKIATPVERRSYNAPTPVYDGNRVIVAGQGSGTKSFSIIKSGSSYNYKELWLNSELGTSFCTPLLKNGFLFANDGRLGKLFCLNLETGTTAWINDETLNRFASILDLGKVLVSLPANGSLIVFEPDGKAYKEIVRYQVSETEVYAHPVFNENNIIIKDKEMLTCWSVK